MLNVSKSTQSNPTDYIKQRWCQDQKYFHSLIKSLLNSLRFFSIFDSPSWVKLLMYPHTLYLPIQLSIPKLPLNPTELKRVCQDSGMCLITIICLFVLFIRRLLSILPYQVHQKQQCLKTKQIKKIFRKTLSINVFYYSK